MNRLDPARTGVPKSVRTRSAALVLGVIGVATGFATPALAQGAPSVAELERAIMERDRVILDMMRRIEALEARVGGASATAASAGTARVGPGPGPEAHAAGPRPKPGVKPAAASTQTASAAKPRPAPGTLEVDEEAAERALERSLVQAGAVLLPRGRMELEPTFVYSRTENANPILLGSGASSFVGEVNSEVTALQGVLGARLGLPYDSQFEVSLPYVHVRNGEILTNSGASLAAMDESGHGFGDLRLSFAKTLLREKGWWPDVVGRVSWDTATGEDVDNGVFLGGGFNEVGGTVSFLKTQDPLVFVGQVGYERAFEDDGVKPGSAVDLGLAAYLALNPSTSVDVGMNFSRANEVELNGVALVGTDQSAWSIDYGINSVLGRGVVLNVFGGFGLTEDAPDVTLGVSLPVRFNSGL